MYVCTLSFSATAFIVLATMADHHIVGREGEDIAMRYLLMSGYSLLGRNVRIGHDEIDLIVFDPMDTVIVFVEVKARSKDDPDFSPVLNFTEHKKACVRRGAQRWIAAQEHEWGWRIDLVLVADGKVADHIKDVGN